MATKPKSDIKILKGQEAEDKVLQYLKMMNRPFGAVDVAANLKGAVPKAATQKILVALAEKGDLVQKIYGKTTFFVANQANLNSIPAEEIATIEGDLKTIDEGNKGRMSLVKSLAAELAKIRSTPTDQEIGSKLSEMVSAVKQATARLIPFRDGTTLISLEEISQIEADWVKWRNEWIRRRKVFMNLWHLSTDTLSPQDASKLSEDLGIEFDTPEHVDLERSDTCTTGLNLLKRKRCCSH